MSYLNQADWFFKTGEPAPVASAPATSAQPAQPMAPSQPTPPPTAEEDEDEEDTEIKVSSPVPAIERKRSSVLLYVLGGLGLLTVGYFLYTKFGGETETEETETEVEPVEASNEIQVVSSKKKKRNRK